MNQRFMDIDIVYSFMVPSVGQKMSVVLLQNVLVIATGSYQSSDRALAMEREGAYSTITLKLSIRDAQRLGYAQQTGNIQILRFLKIYRFI